MIVYFAFAGAYIAVSLSLTLLPDVFSYATFSASTTFVAGWCVSFATAYAAILIATRFGAPRYGGLLLTTMVLAAVWLLYITTVLHTIGNQGVLSTTWLAILGRMDWPSIANDVAQFLVCPLAAWSLVRKQARQRPEAKISG